jgi:hypothetical protein
MRQPRRAARVSRRRRLALASVAKRQRREADPSRLLPRELSGPDERPFGFPLSSNSHVSRQLSEEPETAPFVKDQQSRVAPPLLVRGDSGLRMTRRYRHCLEGAARAAPRSASERAIEIRPRRKPARRRRGRATLPGVVTVFCVIGPLGAPSGCGAPRAGRAAPPATCSRRRRRGGRRPFPRTRRSRGRRSSTARR